MKRISDIITTERLVLRTWRETDMDAFAQMHADPFVMRDLGGKISFEESRAKMMRYIAMYETYGFSRYCVEDSNQDFVGYVGICPRDESQSIGKHNEIGWRLCKSAWGRGYATEAGRACIAEFMRVHPALEIISYTSADNARSQKVMTRQKMDRESARDFIWRDADGTGDRMQVWVSKRRA